MIRVRAHVEQDGRITVGRFARHHLAALYANKDVSLRVTRLTGKATTQQFGWYRGLVLPTVYAQMRADGHSKTVFGQDMPITEQDVHEFLKMVCARDGGDGHLYTMMERPDGPIVNERDMTITQHSEFIRHVIAFANSTLGCNIPLEPRKEMTDAFV